MIKLKHILSNIKISKQDILFLIFNLIMFVCLIILKESTFIINMIGIFSIIQMIISFFYLNNKNISLFSVSGFFIFFTYIFHFGHTYIYILDSNYTYNISNILQNDYNNAINALVFIFITIPFVIFGIGLTSYYVSKKKSYYVPLKKNTYLLMSILIIIICFPIRLYIDINKIILFFQEGYNLSRTFQLNGILNQFASFYFVGFILLIIIFKNKKRIASVFTIFLLFYQCITMLTGNRGIQLISIVFTMYIYYKFIRKPTKYDFISLCIIAIIGMKFLTIMSVQRADGFENPLNLLSLLFSFDNRVILSVLEEFGYTLQTIVLEFRNNITHTFGLTYLYSLFTIFPNVGSFLNNITYNACFVNALNYPKIGGSYIGELYFNFGFFAPLFSILLGFLVGLASEKIEEYINNNKLLQTSFLIMPCITILWWVRNYFKDMPREFIWGLIFFTFLFKFSDIVMKKNKFPFISKPYLANKDNDLVSVIMGVYNTEQNMLNKAINSLLNQTYKNIEIIIVNDNSTDQSTLKLLKDFETNKKIKIINNEQNLGLTRSLNKALEFVNGKFIARMDSDDICELDRIQYQVDFMKEHPNIDVLGGSIQNIGLNHSITHIEKNHNQIAVGLLFKNNYIVHPTVMMRRKVILNNHYDVKYSKSQDYALWCKFVSMAKLHVDSRIVLKYRIHLNQATNAAKDIQNECAIKIRSNYAKPLLSNNQDIELLNKLVLAQISDIAELDYICHKILSQNKKVKIFKQSLLKKEICKYYCYQALKILIQKRKLRLFFKLRYKLYFFKFETLIFLYQYLKNGFYKSSNN